MDFPRFADIIKETAHIGGAKLDISIRRIQIDVDVEKTRQFYDRAKTVSEGCQCDGCLNFERAVDKLPQNIRDFFSALGVDMKKSANVMSIAPKTKTRCTTADFATSAELYSAAKARGNRQATLQPVGTKSNISALAEFWRFVQRPYRHAGAGFSSSCYSARLRCGYPVGARKEKQLY